MVQQTSEAKRDRVYCAQALLDILEEPAHLTPLDEGIVSSTVEFE